MSEKTALYCRLSVEDRNKASGSDSESILNQKLILTDFADKNNWEIYQCYSDDDYSGLDSSRPAFNRMIQDAEKKKFNIILCKSQSRFTRDNRVAEKYINQLFPLWGIRFVSITDNIDTEMKGNKKSRQINGLINEWYSEDISENIRSVFRQKQLEGQFLGSFAPYGYVKSPQDKHQLLIDPYAAAIVQQIFNLYVNFGYGYSRIAAILSKEKILTPTSYKKLKGYLYENPNLSPIHKSYIPWSPNTIAKILSNQVYIGNMVQNKQSKINYKSNKIINVPKENHILCPNTHQPIISKELYEKALQIRASKRISATGKSNPSFFILSGKVKCGACGANLVRCSKSRKGETYLKCRNAVQSNNKHCSYHTVKLETIQAAVIEKIKPIAETCLTDIKCSAISHKNFSFSLHPSNIIDEIKSKIQSLEKLRSILRQDKCKNTISSEEYQSIEKIYAGKIHQYKNILHDITYHANSHVASTHNFTADTFLKNNKAAYLLFSQLIDYIEVNEEETAKNIHIFWNI